MTALALFRGLTLSLALLGLMACHGNEEGSASDPAAAAGAPSGSPAGASPPGTAAPSAPVGPTLTVTDPLSGQPVTIAPPARPAPVLPTPTDIQTALVAAARQDVRNQQDAAYAQATNQRLSSLQVGTCQPLAHPGGGAAAACLVRMNGQDRTLGFAQTGQGWVVFIPR